jgi:uncharacterized membrane protein (UPF0136 family)
MTKYIEIPLVYAVIYGLLLIIGGLMGYLKKKSVISMVAGGLSGITVILTAWITWNSRKKNAGFFTLSTIALTLMFIFSHRYNTSGKKFMPSGLMTMISGISFLIFGVSIIVYI